LSKQLTTTYSNGIILVIGFQLPRKNEVITKKLKEFGMKDMKR
jgi:hypothetical protein